MQKQAIAFRDTKYFSSLICDYLEGKEEVTPLYHRFPNLINFEKQLQEKSESYPDHHRATLVETLGSQYETLSTSDTTLRNIELLGSSTTFTITTGHQLNLFTGPLYFLYKIISTINLTEQLKRAYPDYDFVPIYWMATEDHDFDEINYFNFKGKKIQWNRTDGGAVGDLTTEGLDTVFEVLDKVFGQGVNAMALKNLFKESYAKHQNLADATRYLANALFQDYGLVIVDAHTRAQKQLFVPYMEEELLKQTAYKEVTKQTVVLKEKGYPVQVNPREINLFYLQNGSRKRIVHEDGRFMVHETNLEWSKEAILEHLHKMPECFSPNVIMRPLYQEVLLPNLCYIGGGGELAYWLELKNYFETVKVPFPILLLRNSALLLSQKQASKIEKLQVEIEELFLKSHELINHKVRQISNIPINFEQQKKHLSQQFEALYEMAKSTDPSFEGAVKAQEVKQLKGLEVLEKRLLQAQKRKLSDHVMRLTAVQNELFPNKSLQERKNNFSELYLEYGPTLISTLKETLAPLCGEFDVLVLEDFD